MRARTRLLTAIFVVPPLALGCARKEEPPAASPEATPPRVAVTAAPAATRPSAPASAAPLAAATPPAATRPAPPPPPAPAIPPRAAAPRPKGTISLPAKLGAVTFDHEKHATRSGVTCATCHHASRPPKPSAAEQQACRECHTSPASPPMKTSLQAAFHDPKAGSGTCIDCHARSVAKGAPVKCLGCHKKK